MRPSLSKSLRNDGVVCPSTSERERCCRCGQQSPKSSLPHSPTSRSSAGPDVAPGNNRLTFHIGPDNGIELHLQGKAPGDTSDLAPIDLSVGTGWATPADPARYQRLLADAIDGERRLFACEDSVEAAWKIVGPVLIDQEPPDTYEAGSWGPPTDRLLAPGMAWIDPNGP